MQCKTQKIGCMWVLRLVKKTKIWRMVNLHSTHQTKVRMSVPKGRQPLSFRIVTRSEPKKGRLDMLSNEFRFGGNCTMGLTWEMVKRSGIRSKIQLVLWVSRRNLSMITSFNCALAACLVLISWNTSATILGHCGNLWESTKTSKRNRKPNKIKT